ncbi:inactive hydroxysteroid dehydrogenase-like protein 1 isoform X1 [Arctopsyche grandis]|uniref:inactive hydroxysteroid dehydrogenase-like protein 1 isoform X1 n=1 Tax=Arctopsyche grandis TaxID=121162 RepID=UPI00406D7627
MFLFWLVVAVLCLIGVLALVYKIVDTFWSLAQLTRAHLKPYFQPGEELSLVKKYGPWAVVTGSTDGIGKYYAKELAKQGLNIVLISRTREKLINVANEIEKSHSVKTKIIQADFSQGSSIYKEIEEQLKDIQIGILVNNVGKQYDYPMYLNEVPEKEIWDIININVGAVTMMTRMVLVQMKARGRGAIVNTSSGSELQPLPLMTVYGATKTYINNFTAAIRYEYSKFGITVQHLSPLFVSTKMNSFSDRLMSANLFVPDAETYARHAVSTLGKSDCTTGYWAHGIQYFFIKLPPVWIRTIIGGRMNESFREEYFSRVRSK